MTEESLSERLRKDPRWNLRKPSPEQLAQWQQRSRDTLPVLRGLAETLAAGRGDTHALGTEIWRTSLGTASAGCPEGVQIHALWLLWGALTDWADDPDKRPAAEAAMRRAAGEWLAVIDDEPAWRAYFDRWLYDEMGYERLT